MLHRIIALNSHRREHVTCPHVAVRPAWSDLWRLRPPPSCAWLVPRLTEDERVTYYELVSTLRVEVDCGSSFLQVALRYARQRTPVTTGWCMTPNDSRSWDCKEANNKIAGCNRCRSLGGSINGPNPRWIADVSESWCSWCIIKSMN